jgi:hypothetical protein
MADVTREFERLVDTQAEDPDERAEEAWAEMVWPVIR